MSNTFTVDYFAVGGNRQASAAEWTSSHNGLVAFGAGNGIALWNPLDKNYNGVHELLNGHLDTVTAIAFTPEYLFSGSADKTIKTWRISTSRNVASNFVTNVGQHDATVTNLEVLPERDLLFSAGADSKIKIWSISDRDSGPNFSIKQEIQLRILPLAFNAYSLGENDHIMVVGGSHSSIQIYATNEQTDFEHCAALSGHSAWIRSLHFVRESTNSDSDLLLVSGSQDKFIRLWRVHAGTEIPVAKRPEDPSLGVLGKTISTKVHQFKISGKPYSVMFEALLLGHEDWVYSTKWNTESGTLQLLSSSADNSIAIWRADPSSGIWVCVSRLGDVSSQKGSTTATGSAGGFWNGLWAPDGKTIMTLGRTGSWRVWNHAGDYWLSEPGVGGHTRSVTGVVWSKDGSYLLSTSSDQTTRLHARWAQKENSWREFARPQIHGYDLNCISIINPTTFISGADEKPLRVFQQPAAVATLLSNFSNISTRDSATLPTTANIPVLGLSNKALTSLSPDDLSQDAYIAPYEPDSLTPPTEDTLSKHLLFPEIQKLYGHGYELSAVAASHAGSLIASAAKASAAPHAVIRLHHTSPSWLERAPPLHAHSLTVTRLAWAPDDKWLLAGSRDRCWSVTRVREAERKSAGIDNDDDNDEDDFMAAEHNSDDSLVVEKPLVVKGHTRMILGCAWAPLEAGRVFATAGRDRCVKIWRRDGHSDDDRDGYDVENTLDNGGWRNVCVVPTSSAVTAVAFCDRILEGNVWMAMGLESGEILLGFADVTSLKTDTDIVVVVEGLSTKICPGQTVNDLAFRPGNQYGDDVELAIASEDCSLRVICIPNIASRQQNK